MPAPILNIDSVEFRDWGHNSGGPGKTNPGEHYQAKLGEIGRRLGAQKLGYSLIVVPAGKTAFPFHNHRANEEMFFILSGEGELRVGKERYPLRAGDVICCRTGGPETAHQIANTSNAELKYLGVSTKIYPELTDYPVSGKFGVFAEITDADGKHRVFRHWDREGTTLDYWEGE